MIFPSGTTLIEFLTGTTRMFKLLIVLVLLIFVPVAHAELVVSYRTPATNSTYHTYYTKLIVLALEKTKPKYGDYRMLGAPPNASTLRSLGTVATDMYPNLVIEFNYDDSLATVNTINYIEIPLDGGIFSYRVCFVNPRIKNNVALAKSLDDLRKYSIAQGVGWADSDILRANGFNVIEIANYDNIFKMVVAGRVDLFCRGANQIKPELEEFKDLTQLTYDESFVFYYPLPRFFYINKNNQLAKQRIEEGLRIAFNDGSLKKLWNEEYRENIHFVKLHQRKVFRLQNPLIKNLSLDYERYFFDPMQ